MDYLLRNVTSDGTSLARCHFYVVVFNILSLSSIFVSLITIGHGVFLLGFILPVTLFTFWTLLTISFPMFRKFSAVISLNIYSGPLSLSSSVAPIVQMLVHLMLSQGSLRLSHFFPFFLLCSALQQ